MKIHKTILLSWFVFFGIAINISFATDTDPEAVKASNITYNTIAIRGKGKFQSDKNKLNFAFKIHGEKGKMIWASIAAMGVEAARIVITKDSLKMIDRVKNKYLLAPISDFEKKIGVKFTLDMLEDLLVGNAHVTNTKTDFKEDGKFTWMMYVLETVDLKYQLDKKTLKPVAIHGTEIIKNNVFDVNYSKFTPVEKFNVPFLTKSVIQSDGKEQRFELTYSRVELNKDDLVFSFTIPQDYEPYQN